MEGLSQGMRVELCKSGVKVTCIQPGDVKTELLTHTVDKEVCLKFKVENSMKLPYKHASLCLNQNRIKTMLAASFCFCCDAGLWWHVYRVL